MEHSSGEMRPYRWCAFGLKVLSLVGKARAELKGVQGASPVMGLSRCMPKAHADGPSVTGPIAFLNGHFCGFAFRAGIATLNITPEPKSSNLQIGCA